MNKTLFRLILYLMPAVTDCVTGIFYFIGPVRATQLGYDVLIAGSMVTVRAAVVCLSGFIFSRYLTFGNSVVSMFVSIAGVFCVCVVGFFADNLFMLYLSSALSGIFLVIFACAYQVFIKAVDTDEEKPLERVVGSYTLAWCVGMSLGPLLTGALMTLGSGEGGTGPSEGWRWTYVAAAGLITVNLLCLLWVRRQSADAMSRHLMEKVFLPVCEPERERPDLAWLGWVMALVGTTALGVVNGVFPAEATAAGMPEWHSGLIMTIQGSSMGIFAYLAAMPRNGLYSGRMLFGIGILGAAGLFFYALPGIAGWTLTQHTWQFYPAAVLFGSFCGTVYLYAAFHSLAHPELAGRNIGLCEGFLAAGIIVGSLAGGWLAKRFGFHLPFGLGVGVILALACFQVYAHKRFGGRAPEGGGRKSCKIILPK